MLQKIIKIIKKALIKNGPKGGVFPTAPEISDELIASEPLGRFPDPGNLQGKMLFQADQLANDILAEVYHGTKVPDQAVELLKSPKKPGNVVAIFYCGRSGSMFLQSFFDRNPYPQILTLPPDSLVSLETFQFPQSCLDSLNTALSITTTGEVTKEIVNWTEEVFQRCGQLFDDFEGYTELRPWRAPREAFYALVQAQLAWLAPGALNYDQLLRILFVAHRLSRGQPVDCSNYGKLTFIWQAHVPIWGKEIQEQPRRRWLRQAISNLRTLTVVRFPEKTIDSHLIHHTFEAPQPPLGSLCRRLIFDIGFAYTNEITSEKPDGTEYAVRFEDVHHHSAFVIGKICEWLGMEYDDRMEANDFVLPVHGKKISGARQLSSSEIKPKLLSYFDILKIRFLFQENYRAWGYESMCEPNIEASIQEYRKLAANIPFSCQALLADMGQDVQIAEEEKKAMQILFEMERERRDTGINLLPLLYDLEDISDG